MDQDIPVKIDKTDARQATTAPRMRYVLAGGLALAVIVFIILMIVYH